MRPATHGVTVRHLLRERSAGWRASYWQGEYKLRRHLRRGDSEGNSGNAVEKLVESTDRRMQRRRYILAVMLERKRILKHATRYTRKMQ